MRRGSRRGSARRSRLHVSIEFMDVGRQDMNPFIRLFLHSAGANSVLARTARGSRNRFGLCRVLM